MWFGSVRSGENSEAISWPQYSQKPTSQLHWDRGRGRERACVWGLAPERGAVSMWTKRPVHTCRELASSRLRSRGILCTLTFGRARSLGTPSRFRRKRSVCAAAGRAPPRAVHSCFWWCRRLSCATLRDGRFQWHDVIIPGTLFLRSLMITAGTSDGKFRAHCSVTGRCD